MNTMETICSRKSVRSYTGEQITAEERNIILKAANAAPIGRGQYDSMHLTVITNPTMLQELDYLTAVMMGRADSHALYGAPTLILVSTKAPAAGMENVAYSNAAIVVQNMALAATDLGIGSCHIWGAIRALVQSPELMTKLQLPEGFIPCCGIILGKTEETYSLRDIPMDKIATDVIE